MQPTNQLLGVWLRARIRFVTNAVSHETLLISDFLSHNNILQFRPNSTKIIAHYTYFHMAIFYNSKYFHF